MATEPGKCPDRGTEIPDDAPENLCPHCLLGLAADSSGKTEPMDVEASFAVADITPLEGPGAVIGHYKLLQKIGEGGMGLVYMAEQIEPVRRMVALKIIKLAMDTKDVVARFNAERQALALMDHPNIARVLDAGATKGALGSWCEPKDFRAELTRAIAGLEEGGTSAVVEHILEAGADINAVDGLLGVTALQNVVS